jgi:L-methionine (R)-S-oxide reductase
VVELADTYASGAYAVRLKGSTPFPSTTFPLMFTPEAATQQWLEAFVHVQGGAAGTVHRREGAGLCLIAAVNIPPTVIEVTRVIPVGKGMAGLALERKEPVQTCNLQTDRSGDVRPGARAVQAQAAIALPVFNPTGDVRSVVGLAYTNEQEMPPAQIAQLAQAAAMVP